MNKPKVVIISGATATGKTQLALDLAKNQKAHIINFDSMLFYRELNIGTAKPSRYEQKSVPHSMIDICSIKDPMNAAMYNEQATPIAEKILAENKILFLVGGSGFYIRAFMKGMYETLTPSAATKDKVARILAEDGAAALYAQLKNFDPESAALYHPNDSYRVGRALQHFFETGKSIAEEKNRFEKIDPYNFSQNRFPEWNIIHFCLDIAKPEHEKFIRSRTDSMLKNGLVEEVKNILEGPDVTGDEKALQSIGYKETIGLIRGEISDLKDLADKISISTRQLAKSQRTFFKKITPKLTFDPIKNKEKIFDSFGHFLA